MFIPLIVNTAAIFAFGKEDLRLTSHENEKNSRFYDIGNIGTYILVLRKKATMIKSLFF